MQVDVKPDAKALVQAKVKRITEDISSLTNKDIDILNLGEYIRYLLERNVEKGDRIVTQVHEYRIGARDPSERWAAL